MVFIKTFELLDWNLKIDSPQFKLVVFIDVPAGGGAGGAPVKLKRNRNFIINSWFWGNLWGVAHSDPVALSQNFNGTPMGA